MESEELLLLLVAMLKDEVNGSIVENDNTITVTFENGVTRTVTVS